MRCICLVVVDTRQADVVESRPETAKVSFLAAAEVQALQADLGLRNGRFPTFQAASLVAGG